MGMSSKRSERGSVILFFTLLAIPICAMAGFVVDLGWFHFTQEAANTAAQAAAIAAVRSAMDDVAAGGSYTCASKGLTCQSATTCGSSLPTTFTTNLQSGCAYATLNGFTAGGLSGRQTVTIEANTTSPATYVPGVKVLYWTTVTITQTNPLTLLAVLGQSSMTVNARSTAAVVNEIPNDCVTALDPSAGGALTLSGSSTLTLSGCSIQVNSSAGNALSMNGSACISAPSIEVVGGTSTTSCVQPAPTTGASSVSDPFGSLAPPSLSTTCDYNNMKVQSNSSATLSPGVYCGGLSVGGTASLSAGTYVLLGGGLTCNAGCVMTGSGVTFYNTCNSGYCDGGRTGYKPINIGGQAVTTLSAPTSGSLSGILFFQDRSVSPTSGQNDSIQGGTTSSLEGVLYFPKSGLTFAGGATSPSTSTLIVADQVSFTGNSSMQVSKATTTPTWMPTAALLE
jgi:Flp pilus assembly protein TadG